MFCKNCGTQLEDSQKFCPKCGAPVQQTEGQNAGAGTQPYGQTQGGYQQAPYNGYQQGGQPPKRNSGKSAVFIVIGIIVLIAVAAAVIFGVRSCSGGSSYTAPVDNFMEGIEKKDGDKIMNAFSDGTVKALEEQTGYSKSEIADMFESQFSASVEEYGDYTIDYEVTEETDLSDDDIADIQDQFDAQDIDEKIQAGKSLEIEATLKIDGESEDETMELQVIKIDGKWYIDPTSM